MKNLILFPIVISVFVTACNNTKQGEEIVPGKKELVSDSLYVKIGNQLWARKNLSICTFRNGDTIPEVKTNEEWIAICKAEKPAWCYFENDPENDSLYGKLYNWYAVNDPRGLAPKGEHIPSDMEWIRLTEFLGGRAIAGKKLKSKQGWEYNGNGSNSSHFSANPAGERHADGEFSSLGLLTAWWTSTEHKGKYAWENYMYHFNNNVSTLYVRKNGGFSVRCVKDQ